MSVHEFPTAPSGRPIIERGVPGCARSSELEALSRTELEQRAKDAGLTDKPEEYPSEHLIYGIQKRGAIGNLPPWGML